MDIKDYLRGKFSDDYIYSEQDVTYVAELVQDRTKEECAIEADNWDTCASEAIRARNKND